MRIQLAYVGIVLSLSLGNVAFGQTYVITPQAPAANEPILISATWPHAGYFVDTKTYVISGNTVSVRFVQVSEEAVTPASIQAYIVVPPLPPGTYKFNIDWDPGPGWSGLPPATQTFAVAVGQARPVGGPIELTQSADGRVAAHVADYLPEGCLSGATGQSFPTPGFFYLVTSSLCPPPATPVLYTATVDLGLMPDGDYGVVWYFVAADFGPTGISYSRSFTIQGGLLVVAVEHAPVTPVCVDPKGCVQTLPAAPTSNQKIEVSIQPGIPPEAVIPYSNISVANGTVTIEGKYRQCNPCSVIPLPPQPVQVQLEPLAAGHYAIEFRASADPNSYGPNGYVQTADGPVQAPVLITGAVDVAPSSAPTNYEGLWWAAPAGSESGWGINLAHQGDLVFASWFTYDLAGKAFWLVMTGAKTDAKQYSGQLYQVSGPAFDAAPFAPIGSPGGAVGTVVGTGSLTFDDATHGVFAYTVNGISQTKPITREIFGPLPNCTFGVETDLTLATNYQDLWWAAPAGSQSGWGMNLTHQGDIIFATWYTFDRDHTPMWVAMTAVKARFYYIGQLYRTAGPPFNSAPFPSIGAPGGATGSIVGNGALLFHNGNSATFYYTLNGVAGVQDITREVFVPPGTVCQ